MDKEIAHALSRIKDMVIVLIEIFKEVNERVDKLETHIKEQNNGKEEIKNIMEKKNNE